MKNNFVTKNAISVIGGLCFILFALVTLLSSNTPFAFLHNIITQSFGFIGFWLLLPFIFVVGLYLILNKKLVKIKLGTKLWGAFIILVCFLILSSHWGSWGAVVNGVEIVGRGRTESGTARYLTFSNAISVFEDIAKNNVASFGPSPKLGGGRVGYLLAGALNSALTPLGLNIVCWALFVGGLVIIFNKQFAKLFALLSRISFKKDKSEYKETTLVMADSEPEEPIIEEPKPKVEEKAPPVFDNTPLYESFHTSPLINNDYDLKKAHFNISDESQPKDIYNEEMSKAVFEEPKTEDIDKPRPFFERIEPQVEESSKEYHSPTTPVTPLRSNEAMMEQVNEPQASEEVDYNHRPQPKAQPFKSYIYPSIDLLNQKSKDDNSSVNEESCEARTEIINKTLANLRVGAKVVSHTVGPSVTRFDVETEDGVSVDSVSKAINTISVKLGGLVARFEPIVVGKSTSGLEIPNEVRTNVTLREAVEGLPKGPKNNLVVPFGVSISGELKYGNLADFPHLLVAGTTGSGKSIFVHATIVSLIMRNKPDELKLILVDPKKVEMSFYDDIPHLLCPVISDMKKVLVCFNKLVEEMERRYTLFQTNRLRDIKGFNEFAKESGLQPLPYIVVFIDEYADLIDTCKEIREPVVRIVQKARAAGIHMVFATQRPSVNVIDGVIKGNVATRVALMCASPQDSMVVLGEGGAESLLGNGDMLVDCAQLSRVMKTRVQGCYVSNSEITRVCNFLREHYQPQFDPMFLNLEPVVEAKKFEEVEVSPIDKSKTDEEAYQRIKEDTMHREYMSISYITRSYGMGFSRAGKMFKRLQDEGVVATSGDARGCKVLMYNPYQSEDVTTPEQSTFVPDEW